MQNEAYKLIHNETFSFEHLKVVLSNGKTSINSLQKTTFKVHRENLIENISG
jgi:hypothetical protein